MLYDLSKVALIVNDLYIDNQALYGKLDIINTPEGKKLNKLIKKNKATFTVLGEGTLLDTNKIKDWTLLCIQYRKK